MLCWRWRQVRVCESLASFMVGMSQDRSTETVCFVQLKAKPEMVGSKLLTRDPTRPGGFWRSDPTRPDPTGAIEIVIIIIIIIMNTSQVTHATRVWLQFLRLWFMRADGTVV